MSVRILFVRDTDGKPGMFEIVDDATETNSKGSRSYDWLGRLVHFHQDKEGPEFRIFNAGSGSRTFEWVLGGDRVFWNLAHGVVAERPFHGLHKRWNADGTMKNDYLTVRGRLHGRYRGSGSWNFNGQFADSEAEFRGQLPITSQFVSVLPLSAARRVVTFLQK